MYGETCGMVMWRDGVMGGLMINMGRLISMEIDGGKHIGGQWTVSQGYGGRGLSHAQLYGATTIGWAALDRTMIVHIAPHTWMEFNA